MPLSSSLSSVSLSLSSVPNTLSTSRCFYRWAMISWSLLLILAAAGGIDNVGGGGRGNVFAYALVLPRRGPLSRSAVGVGVGAGGVVPVGTLPTTARKVGGVKLDSVCGGGNVNVGPNAAAVPSSFSSSSSLFGRRRRCNRRADKPLSFSSSSWSSSSWSSSPFAIAAATSPSSSNDDSTPITSGEGTASIPNEIFNLVKSIVGAGVLSLPAGIAAFGSAPSAVVPAAIMTLLIGALSGYTFSIIARVCKNTGATSYGDAWDKTRGSKTSWIVAVSSALDCVMGNLSYSMILADTFKDLLASGGIAASRTTALLVITTLVLTPLCFVKNLSSLAPFSLLGIMGMLYTSVAIAIRYFGGTYALAGGKYVSDLATHLKPSFGNVGASGALGPQSLIMVCMLSTAYIAHFNAPKFYRELKNNTMKRFNTVVTASFGLSVALYVAVASMGFLTFGSASQGLILNNYSTKDALVGLSRFTVGLSIIFSYPLLFVGARDGILDLARVPDADRTDSIQNKLTIGLLAFITILAARIRDLSFISSLSGAVFGTALIFIFPPLMLRKMIKDMSNDDSSVMTKSLRWEMKFAKLTAALGVIVGIIGTKLSFASS